MAAVCGMGAQGMYMVTVVLATIIVGLI
jgi:transmembrane 9 superfamily protein 2/4